MQSITAIITKHEIVCSNDTISTLSQWSLEHLDGFSLGAYQKPWEDWHVGHVHFGKLKRGTWSLKIYLGDSTIVLGVIYKNNKEVFKISLTESGKSSSANVVYMAAIINLASKDEEKEEKKKSKRLPGDEPAGEIQYNVQPGITLQQFFNVIALSLAPRPILTFGLRCTSTFKWLFSLMEDGNILGEGATASGIREEMDKTSILHQDSVDFVAMN
ncbi:hypothetical protein BJ165DRAFT_1518133 [Panaeolus papilionaceus]|nr:hypothetical protein BJ165DRAFT_1518133 [Panaeolus papilionaceus]